MRSAMVAGVVGVVGVRVEVEVEVEEEACSSPHADSSC